MILCLNNMKNFSRANNTFRKCIDSNTFPEQDEEKIGKLVHLKFRDEKDQITRQRLNINKNKFPDFTGENTYDDWFFKIIRYDKVFPFRVILKDSLDRVLVTTTSEISSLFVHPGYKFVTNYKDTGDNELVLPVSEWETFNKLYLKDHVHCYPVQDDQLLGKSVYIEYYNDLFKPRSENNIILDLYNQKKPFSEIRDEIISMNPELEVFDNNILASFPIYYNRHQKDLIDCPL